MVTTWLTVMTVSEGGREVTAYIRVAAIVAVAPDLSKLPPSGGAVLSLVSGDKVHTTKDYPPDYFYGFLT